MAGSNPLSPLTRRLEWYARVFPESVSESSQCQTQMRPYLLVVLSIALFAWGIGYKMEGIRSGSAVVRQIPVAKLWIKPRIQPEILATARTDQTGASGLSACLPPSTAVGAARSGAYLQWARLTRPTQSSALLLPVRAPPIHSFSLA